MEGEDVVDSTEPNFSRCAVITIDTQNDFSLPGAIAEIKGTHGSQPDRLCLLLYHPVHNGHLRIVHGRFIGGHISWLR